jgi:hypothetical protein
MESCYAVAVKLENRRRSDAMTKLDWMGLMAGISVLINTGLLIAGSGSDWAHFAGVIVGTIALLLFVAIEED